MCNSATNWRKQRADYPFDRPQVQTTRCQCDPLMRNALVIDGACRPRSAGDIGMRGGRVAAIGRLQHARAAREIDAPTQAARGIDSVIVNGIPVWREGHSTGASAPTTAR